MPDPDDSDPAVDGDANVAEKAYGESLAELQTYLAVH